MYTKVPLPDEGLFYTQQIDFEPVEVVVIEEVSDTESFDDYLWMENEEEFEKTEMQRLEEEALMEECVEAMQDDEDEEEVVLEHLRLCHSEELLLSESTLNPLAIEFIPANWGRRQVAEERKLNPIHYLWIKASEVCAREREKVSEWDDGRKEVTNWIDVEGKLKTTQNATN